MADKTSYPHPVEHSSNVPPPMIQQPNIQQIPMVPLGGHPIAPPNYDQSNQPLITVPIVATTVVHHHTG